MSSARATARKPSAPQPARLHAGRHGAEREAELAGEAAAQRMPFAGWSFKAVAPGPPEAVDDPRVVAAIAGPGRALEPAARSRLEAQLGGDLSTVRLHEGADAASATRSLGAEGLAHGEDVALVEPFDATSPRSRRLVAHEVAHVVQQRAGGAAAVQLDTGGKVTPVTRLDALPEADRQRIRVVTDELTLADINDLFDTVETTTSAFPSGVTATFDASVDAALQHGLKNVAGELSQGMDAKPLAENSTVTLELDVPGKGKGLYRFTYHAPPARGKGKPPARRILIEALGKATAPAGTKTPAAPDKVTEKIKNHSFKHSYTGAALDALRAALDQIPDAQLSIVDGLQFARDIADPDPKVLGHYASKTHTVTMFDNAFASGTTRFKSAGTTASDVATRAIVHEIGHAIDRTALRTAGVAYDKAATAVNSLSAKYPNPAESNGAPRPGGRSREGGGGVDRQVRGRCGGRVSRRAIALRHHDGQAQAEERSAQGEDRHGGCRQRVPQGGRQGRR